jgi:hypothetical protein
LLQLANCLLESMHFGLLPAGKLMFWALQPYVTFAECSQLSVMDSTDLCQKFHYLVLKDPSKSDPGLCILAWTFVQIKSCIFIPIQAATDARLRKKSHMLWLLGFCVKLA